MRPDHQQTGLPGPRQDLRCDVPFNNHDLDGNLADVCRVYETRRVSRQLLEVCRSC